jgi:hypothetical protein
MVKSDDRLGEVAKPGIRFPPFWRSWVPWGDLWISRFRLWWAGNGCLRACPPAFRSVRGPGIRRSLVTACCCRLGSAKALLFAPPFILLSTFKHYCSYLVSHAWFSTLLLSTIHWCTEMYINALIRPLMPYLTQWCWYEPHINLIYIRLLVSI